MTKQKGKLGVTRFRCDGCGKLIAQKQEQKMIIFTFDDVTINHAHGYSCYEKYLKKSGMQMRLL